MNNRRKPAARVPRSSRSSTSPQSVGDRGTKMISNGGEPIYLGRNLEDRRVPNRDIPMSATDVNGVREYVKSTVLGELGLSPTKYEAGRLSVEERRKLFVATYGHCGNVKVACTVSAVTRLEVEGWRMDIADFKRDMDLAYEDCIDELEQLAVKSATVGVPWEETTEKSVVGPDGKQVGAVERTTRSGVERNDGMLMFILRGRRSKIYGNKTELTGDVAIEVKEIVMRPVAPKKKGDE